MFACGTTSPTPEQAGNGGRRPEKLQPFVWTRFRTCVGAAWTFHWRFELAGHSPPVPTARDGTLDIKREPPKKTKKIVGLSLGLVGDRRRVGRRSVVSGRRLRPSSGARSGSTRSSAASMTRDVNAPGTLEPEYVRNVTALTNGRVEELAGAAWRSRDGAHGARRAEQSRRTTSSCCRISRRSAARTLGWRRSRRRCTSRFSRSRA